MYNLFDGVTKGGEREESGEREQDLKTNYPNNEVKDSARRLSAQSFPTVLLPSVVSRYWKRDDGVLGNLLRAVQLDSRLSGLVELSHLLFLLPPTSLRF